MYRYPAVMLLVLFLGCRSSSEQADRVTEVPLTLETIDSLLTRAIFGDTLVVEVLFTGKGWLESPLVLPNGDVICSDVKNNEILRWTGTGSEVYLKHSGGVADDYSREPGSNGLALDRAGRLLLCQHGSRKVVRLDSDPSDPEPVFTVLADNYLGKRFNSPNDLFVAADGSILFTDPPYGLPEDESSEIGFSGVYHIDTLGAVTLLTKSFTRPNGISLNQAEDRLYIGQSDGANPIVAQMMYSAGKEHKGLIVNLLDSNDFNVSDPGSPDGLEVSGSGHVYATVPGGMCIVDPISNKTIAKIHSDRPISNLTISPANDWLYLTNDDRLVRVKLNEL